MDVVVYDEKDRRYVPLGLVLVLVVLLALAVLAGVLALLRGGEAAAPRAAPLPQQTSSDAAGTQEPSADCLAALSRADAALARAERLESELAAYTRAMDDLLAKRSTSDELVNRSLPVLTESATDRRRFAEELQTYRASRKACGQGSG